MSYSKSVVKKPWGYEYLVYENEYVGLWFLHIQEGQSTSMHCHPNKTTGLMVIDGEAEVSFLSNTFDLKPCHKLMIRKGLFHSTKAISKNGAQIFEIETPVDKHDLVRLDDQYGRTGKPYESKFYESPKYDDCLWIEDPKDGIEITYKFKNLKIKVASIKTIKELENLPDHLNIIFLRGGISTDYDINVAGPGDIVRIDVLKKLTNVFKKINKKTIILKVENDDQQ